MTNDQRKKLQAACDLVAKRLREGIAAVEIILELEREHGATYDARWDGNKLRAAGVAASCTWSADVGLLSNWRKTATTRLMVTA